MAKKLNNSELRAIGFYELDLIKLAGRIAKNLIKNKIYDKDQILPIYKALLEKPTNYLEHEHLSEVAEATQKLQPIESRSKQTQKDFELRTEPMAYKIYGAEGIEDGALQQMNTAMKLPITVAGTKVEVHITDRGVKVVYITCPMERRIYRLLFLSLWMPLFFIALFESFYAVALMFFFFCAMYNYQNCFYSDTKARNFEKIVTNIM